MENNNETLETLASSVVDQAKHQAKMWFIAFIVTLFALVGTNAYWIYTFQSYEYIQQYSDGVNNINSGTQGDLTNESDSKAEK